MGTSTSHPSPKTTGWTAVWLGYKDSTIPIRRIITEIWRACQSQPNPLPSSIQSEIVFTCQQVIRDSSSAAVALQKVTQQLIKSKQNSVVTEFVKRAIPTAFRATNPARAWRSVFFSELTDYLVSRDISAYLGEQFRNKSIADLIAFKAAIRKEVSSIVEKVKADPATVQEWGEYIQHTVANLSTDK